MAAPLFSALLLLSILNWPGTVSAIPAVRVDTAVAAVDPQILSTIYVPRSACPVSSTTVPAIATSTTPISDGNTQAPTILQPTAGVNVDTSAHENLIPNNFANLTYYQAEVDDAGESTIAAVSVDQPDYASVNMLHSSSISSLTCSESTAKVTFNSTEAFEMASTNWPSAIPFVMITYHEECGEAYAKGEHGFVLANRIISIDPSNLSIELEISHVDLGTAVGPSSAVTVDIGSYAPGHLGSFGVISSIVTTNPKSGLNSTFDEDLDDSLGPYISLENATHWLQLLPNVTGALPTDGSPATSGDGFPSLNNRKKAKRSFVRRWFWDKIIDTFETVGDAFVSVGEMVVNTATSVGNYIVEEVFEPIADWVGNAVDDVENAALNALNVLDRFLTVDKSLTELITVNEYPSNADSPWGRGYSIYSDDNIQAYCVGCGVGGQITISGRLTFSVAHGLQEGSIAADGNLHGKLQLGLVAHFEYSRPLDEKTLAKMVLSDLVLPGILQIGPSIALSAGGSLELAARGQLTAGAFLDWPAIHAKLDVAPSGGAEATGFQLTIESFFSADGEMTAKLDLHLRAKLGFTIGLLNIDKFTKELVLVDQPGIKASALVNSSATLAGVTFPQGCAGVFFSGNVYNTVYADLAGSKKDILSWTSPALSHCVRLFAKRDLDDDELMSAREISAGMPVRRQDNGTTNEDQSGAADNATYSVISSLDGLFEIHWSSNGNMYAITANDTTDYNVNNTAGETPDSSFVSSDITTMFSTFNSTFILGDSDGRTLIGYSDELSAHNVTRVRLHPPSALPATAVVLSLRPLQDANEGPDLLGAMDTAGNVFAPIICAYKAQFPKLFFAREPINGVHILGNLPEVTGPGIVSCGYVPLTMEALVT